MKKRSTTDFLNDYFKIHQSAIVTNDGNRCMISPHPDLKKKIKVEIKKLEAANRNSILVNKIRFEDVSRTGLNDGLIYPGDTFPLGTTASIARSARLVKNPLRG